MIRVFISQSVPIRFSDRGRCEVSVKVLWWGRSDGYSSVWVKVNGGRVVLNIEDSPCPPIKSLLQSYITIFLLMFLVCVKEWPLAAKEGEFVAWCIFHHRLMRCCLLQLPVWSKQNSMCLITHLIQMLYSRNLIEESTITIFWKSL